ncbi:MAG TPA: ester cyclase [Verrucomicrobiae bacterium]|nr:ester cyclase [Verrucomicrobiae bacterium]
MKGTVEEFKQKYRELTDEALIEINREELVEAARPCLDEEMAKRGLAPAAPVVETEEPLPPLDEWVTVGVFPYPSTTQVVQSALESAGIPNFQPDQLTLDIQPWWALALEGRRILVPPSYAEQARDILGPTIAEGNKLLMESWFEDVWNGRKDRLAAEYGAGVDPQIREAAPDLHVTVEEMVAEANKVAARIAISGTRDEKPTEFHAAVFARIEHGRIEDVRTMKDAPAGR